MGGFAGLWLSTPNAPAAWLVEGARLLAMPLSAQALPEPAAAPPDADVPFLFPDGRGFVDADAGFAWAAHGPGAGVAAGPAGRVAVAVMGLPFDEEPDGGPSFASVEALAAFVEEAGPERALARWPENAAGVVWDRRRRRCWLLRDAMGRHPVLYGWMAGLFAAAHDLRAFDRFARAFGPAGALSREGAWGPTDFRRLGQWRPEIDRDALAGVVRCGRVGWPRTIHRGVYALSPGAALPLAPAHVAERPADFSPWPLGAGRGGTHPVEWSRFARVDETIGDADGAADRLDAALARYFARRADGDGDGDMAVALSGGLDSSLVAARLARLGRPARALTIGFDEAAFDEASAARGLAEALGLPHAVARVGADDLPGLVRRLVDVYDQPYGNPSAVPTMALMRYAADAGVRRLYLGDGGDEAFAGYRRHWRLPDWWRRLSRVPWPLRRAAAWCAARVPARCVARPLKSAWPVEFGRQGAEGLWDRCTAALGAWDALDFHLRFHAIGFPPDAVLAPGMRREDGEPAVFSGDGTAAARDAGGVDAFGRWFRLFLEFDRAHGMVDDGFVKIQPAARHAGLALRLPFSDPGVWRVGRACLPAALRRPDGAEGGVGKQPIRRLLERDVPDQIWNRPKRGFGAPVGAWLRGPLRDWAEALLDEKRLAAAGWWKPPPVRRAWARHLEGRTDAGLRLWPILALEQWRQPV